MIWELYYTVQEGAMATWVGRPVQRAKGKLREDTEAAGGEAPSSCPAELLRSQVLESQPLHPQNNTYAVPWLKKIGLFSYYWVLRAVHIFWIQIYYQMYGL